jgi:flagellar basal-body rod protein FlgB
MLQSPEERTLNTLINAVADRQELLANNLTNVRTPGYVRQDIDFGSLMRDLKNAEEGNTEININTSIQKATYMDEGGKLNYERELAAMMENQIKYVLLTRINGHIYKHMEEATQSGRAA